MKKELHKILSNLELIEQKDFLDEDTKHNLLKKTIDLVKKLYEIRQIY